MTFPTSASPNAVFENPPIQPVVTEYQLRAVACPHCGEITRPDPPAGMPSMVYGPRAVAIANLLHIHAKQGDRDRSEPIATCKQQNRHLLIVLSEAVDAHWAGTPLQPTRIPGQGLDLRDEEF